MNSSFQRHRFVTLVTPLRVCVCKGYIFLQFELEKFSEVANDVDAIALAPLAKFDSVCDTVQGEDEYAEDGTGN